MFFLDAADCKNPDLIRKLESLADQNFLNSYVAVKTGSGFIIDSRGYTLTNRHVVLFKNLNESRKSIGANIAGTIIKKYDYSFSESEKAQILIDFINMFANAKYRFTGILADQEYEIEVLEISPEDSDDLALIRLKGNSGFSSIKLADSETINNSLIGETVYSFGYPLGSLITHLFQDRIVSMNKGNISAFRDDELSIQHNAAISKGNSGGPLVNNDIEVVGINTALIESGNSLYYSIGIDKAATFLIERGYSDILKWNKRYVNSEEVKVNLETNQLGELESSSDLLILGEEGAEIYLDNNLIGKSPMYVNLYQPLSNLRIVGTDGEFTAKIRWLNSLSGTTELIPRFERKLVSLNIKDSAGELVEVFADGQFLGTTPLDTELPGDVYTLSFKSRKDTYTDMNIDLREESSKEIRIHGVPGYRVKIMNFTTSSDQGTVDEMNLILGKATSRMSGSFVFRSRDNETIVKNSFNEPIVLREGRWTLEVQGIPDWEGQQIDFEVHGETMLDLLKYGGSGTLTIRNFKKGMEVYVDRKKIENPSPVIPDLPLGLHDIYIWKDGKLPYEIDITVRKNNSAFVTFQPKTAPSTKARLWGSSGLLCAGAGLVLGLIDTDPYALSKTNNYREYVDEKEKIALMSSGLIITGAIMLLPALVEWVTQGKINKRYREVQGATQ